MALDSVERQDIGFYFEYIFKVLRIYNLIKMEWKNMHGPIHNKISSLL